jgi:hypothetical protein
MQGKRTPLRYEPVLLLDPEMDRATSLATQLESIGFPTRTGSTGTAAPAASIYRHGEDACVTAPASIDDLTGRLAAFQLRAAALLSSRQENAYHWPSRSKKTRGDPVRKPSGPEAQTAWGVAKIQDCNFSPTGSCKLNVVPIQKPTSISHVSSVSNEPRSGH